MNTAARSRKSTARHSARLGAYLAAGLGASTIATSTADAAIVNIDIGEDGFAIGGVNAGLTTGSYVYLTNFPSAGPGVLYVGNQAQVGDQFAWTGLVPFPGWYFATAPTGFAVPTIFASNALIDGSSYFVANASFISAFKLEGSVSATSASFARGNYMGFKTANNNFGWLEVTWDGTNFEVFSGAYEDQPNVAILAGNAAPIPEPGTWVAMAVLAGGAAFARWRKRRDEAA